MRTYTALAVAVLASSAGGQTEVQKLTANNGAAGDQFGRAIAANGEFAVVGAPFWSCETDPGLEPGKAFVFKRNGLTWNQSQRLYNGGCLDETVGSSLDIDGERMVVGAKWKSEQGLDRAGVALVFRGGFSWSLEKQLVAPDPSAGDEFGFSSAIDGDVIVVGAPFEDGAGDKSGAAYVYRWNGARWTFEQKLVSSDATAGDQFGFSVEVNGNWILVGANLEHAGGMDDAGSLYAFLWDGNTWSENQKLAPSDAAPGDQFGVACAMRGSEVLVGAWRADTPAGTDAGSSYLFELDTGTGLWQEQEIFHAPDATGSAHFGRAVAFDGEVGVVGAPGAGAGSAYLLARENGPWHMTSFSSSDGQDGDQFGRSVGIFKGRVFVGAALADTQDGADAGAAYIFDFRGDTFTVDPIDPEADYDDLAHAVDDVPSGSTLQVSGDYSYQGDTWAAIEIDRDLTIAASGARITIDTFSTFETVIETLDNTTVSIDGLNVYGSGIYHWQGVTALINRSVSLSVSNCVLSGGQSQYGVYCDTVDRGGYGIVHYGGDLLVSDSHVEGSVSDDYRYCSDHDIGGIYDSWRGGHGMIHKGSSLTLNNSTVVGGPGITIYAYELTGDMPDDYHPQLVRGGSAIAGKREGLTIDSLTVLAPGKGGKVVDTASNDEIVFRGSQGLWIGYEDLPIPELFDVTESSSGIELTGYEFEPLSVVVLFAGPADWWAVPQPTPRGYWFLNLFAFVGLVSTGPQGGFHVTAPDPGIPLHVFVQGVSATKLSEPEELTLE